MNNDINRKEKLLRKELEGLDVQWKAHFSDDITQALVNGHSIIWHEYAYTIPEEDTVEVMFKGGDDVEAHVPIKGLRSRVA